MQYFLGISILFYFVSSIFFIRLIVKVYKHEYKNKPIPGRNSFNVMKAINYIRDNHPDYFDNKVERLMLLFTDELGNIVGKYLKDVNRKTDSQNNVRIEWKKIKEDFALRYDRIITIHSHPKGLMRSSYGDIMVHKKFEKFFKLVTSLVVDRKVEKFIEYDFKNNFYY
jgi:DNA repair protein RadC